MNTVIMIKPLAWAINACEKRRGLGLVIAGINRSWAAQNQPAPLHIKYGFTNPEPFKWVKGNYVVYLNIHPVNGKVLAATLR